jgi:hypothetical protein
MSGGRRLRIAGIVSRYGDVIFYLFGRDDAPAEVLIDDCD